MSSLMFSFARIKLVEVLVGVAPSSNSFALIWWWLYSKCRLFPFFPAHPSGYMCQSQSGLKYTKIDKAPPVLKWTQKVRHKTFGVYVSWGVFFMYFYGCRKLNNRIFFNFVSEL
jgi:hypothetical protein